MEAKTMFFDFQNLPGKVGGRFFGSRRFFGWYWNAL